MAQKDEEYVDPTEDMTPQEKQLFVKLLETRYERHVRILVSGGEECTRGKAMECRDLIKLLS